MSMEINGNLIDLAVNKQNYGNYMNVYTNQVKKQDNTVNAVDKNDTEKYLSELQKRHKEINIMSGSVDLSRQSGTGKTDVRIASNILAEMDSNPEAEAKYGRMLSAIPRLNKWADSMIKAMTGSEVQYRQVWIDENGDMGSFVITGPSQEQKKAEEMKNKEKEENADRIEKKKEERIRVEKWLEKENGEFEICQMKGEEIGKRIRFDARM